jgi:hypothetical protein
MTTAAQISLTRVGISLVCRHLVIFCCLHEIFRNPSDVLEGKTVAVLARSISLVCRHFVIFHGLFEISRSTFAVLETKTVTELASGSPFLGGRETTASASGHGGHVRAGDFDNGNCIAQIPNWGG